MTRHYRPIPNKCSVFLDAMATVSRPTHPVRHTPAPRRRRSTHKWSAAVVLVCCLASGLLLLG